MNARARALAMATIALALGAPLFIDLAWIALCGFLGALAAVSMGVRLFAAAAALGERPGHAPALPDSLLPTYTIIVPLYREAGVVARLAAAIGALDWTRDEADQILRALGFAPSRKASADQPAAWRRRTHKPAPTHPKAPTASPFAALANLAPPAATAPAPRPKRRRRTRRRSAAA